MDNDVFYNYIDWTLEVQPRPFYVGKGKYHRTKLRERNAYWKNIVAKYGWRREIVLATKDEKFALEEEKRRIAELGTFEDGTPGRWGANLTEGGEGRSGNRAPKSDEHKAKIRAARIGKCKGADHPMFHEHPRRKLSASDVERIKCCPADVTNEELAKQFRVVPRHICDIRVGKIWCHIRPELNLHPSVFYRWHNGYTVKR